MAKELEFERPLMELQQQIEEVKRSAQERDEDRTADIRHLEAEAADMQRQIYASLSPWQKRKLAAQTSRPTTLDYIQFLFTDFIELHGDRLFGDDPAIVGGIARFEGRPVTVIGHQKGHDTKENLYRNFGMPHPEGYRKALRLMQQADKFGRPIICFVDTPGAYPGMAAEERGQSEAIARNLREMALLRVPVITVVTGEGGSGGALALGVGDRLYMLEHAIYSVISPEGAAALLWKDASQAQRAAETMRITAQDLYSFGIADGIIEEPLGGAQKDYQAQAGFIREALAVGLRELTALSTEELLQRRYEKYKAIGPYHE